VPEPIRPGRSGILSVVETFEFFDHQADVGVFVRASSLPGVFRGAARAMMEWIGPAPEGSMLFREKVSLGADDREELLVRWLQELLYLFQQRHAYVIGFSDLEVRERRIRGIVSGKIWGESTARHYREVKAMTYHRLRIERRERIWRASFILDV
jgi:SHS2 domain-containing protein